METATIARVLVNEFISWFGAQTHLHTDQGRSFESSLIKEISRLMGIVKTRTTPYHPQSDGLIEWFNRTLLSMLRMAAVDDETNWDLRIPCLMLPVNVSLFVKDLRKWMSEAYERVRSHLSSEQRRHKQIYDVKVAGKPFTRGRKVWLNNPVVPRGQSKKLHRFWKGPYTVVDVWDNCVYRIKQDAVPHKQHTVHFDRLKPYVERVLQECGTGGSQSDVKPKEGEVEEGDLDIMVHYHYKIPKRPLPYQQMWMEKNPSWLTTLEMMEKQWNLLQRQMSKPKILPHPQTIYVDQPVRDGLLKDWEPVSTFKSTRVRVPYGGGSNVTVSRASCTKDLEHSFY
eukprot:Em0001g2477a